MIRFTTQTRQPNGMSGTSRFSLFTTLLALFLVGCSASGNAGDGNSGDGNTGDRGGSEEEDRIDPLRAAATEIPDDVEEFEVEGLTVILRKTGSSFHTVFAKLYIRGGLTALPPGVSPAMEQMALDVARFSGPDWMDRRDFQKEVDRLHLGLGATAERDFSTYSLRSVDENFDRAWEIWTGIIMNPSFDPVSMENIRERAITGVRNRRVVPESYAEYLADSIFFHGHPYGRVAEEADFVAITEADLRKYRQSLFVKSRLFLVVVGNISREEITEKIRGTLGKLPKGDYSDPKVPVPANAKRTVLHISPPWGRDDVPTNYLVARHLGPSHDDDLFYAMERLRGFVGGLLFRRIRIERNLSYAPGASTYNHRIGFGDISISTVYPDSAWRVTKGQIINFFRGYVIDESNLTDIPATWYTSQYMGMQTAESQATELGAAYFFQGDWREAYRSLEKYLEVTPEELNEVAQKYFANFTIVLVGNPDQIDPKTYLPPDPDDD